MATYKIKNEYGQIRQLNLNDTAGELLQTRNIDLHSNPGKIKLARPFKQILTATQVGDDLVVGFGNTGTTGQANKAYTLTANNLYEATSPFTSWSTSSSSPARAEDCTVFQGQLVFNSATNLDAWDFTSTYTTGWWTARGNPALTTNNPSTTVPRVLETARVGTETLIALDGSNVYGYVGGIGSGAVTSVTLDLDTALTASCFKSSIRAGWIGTYTHKSDQAYVIQWDCASTNYTQAFPVGSKAVLAIEIVDDSPLIITERGEIKLFNNAGFVTKAQFPFAGRATFLDQSTNPNNASRPIHPKGMKRYGNTVFIHTNFRRPDGTELPIDNLTPNGLWALDLTTWSLTHLGAQNNEVLFGNSGASPVMVINDYQGRIFLGGDRNTASNEEGVYLEDLDDTVANYGYVVTTEIDSSDVKDLWEKVSAKSYLETNDKLQVKFRGSKVEDYPVVVENIAWTSTTQFTTTDTDMATVKTRFDAGNEDEVEILTGQSASRLAHITAISYSNPTYTVTVDETIGSNGQTSNIRIDNWQKIPTEITDPVESLGIGKSSDWIQLKIALIGKAGNPEIREIAIKSNTKEKL